MRVGNLKPSAVLSPRVRRHSGLLPPALLCVSCLPHLRQPHLLPAVSCLTNVWPLIRREPESLPRKTLLGDRTRVLLHPVRKHDVRALLSSSWPHVGARGGGNPSRVTWPAGLPVSHSALSGCLCPWAVTFLWFRVQGPDPRMASASLLLPLLLPLSSLCSKHTDLPAKLWPAPGPLHRLLCLLGTFIFQAQFRCYLLKGAHHECTV